MTRIPRLRERPRISSPARGREVGRLLCLAFVLALCAIPPARAETEQATGAQSETTQPKVEPVSWKELLELLEDPADSLWEALSVRFKDAQPLLFTEKGRSVVFFNVEWDRSQDGPQPEKVVIRYVVGAKLPPQMVLSYPGEDAPRAKYNLVIGDSGDIQAWQDKIGKELIHGKKGFQLAGLSEEPASHVAFSGGGAGKGESKGRKNQRLNRAPVAPPGNLLLSSSPHLQRRSGAMLDKEPPEEARAPEVHPEKPGGDKPSSTGKPAKREGSEPSPGPARKTEAVPAGLPPDYHPEKPGGGKPSNTGKPAKREESEPSPAPSRRTETVLAGLPPDYHPEKPGGGKPRASKKDAAGPDPRTTTVYILEPASRHRSEVRSGIILLSEASRTFILTQGRADLKPDEAEVFLPDGAAAAPSRILRSEDSDLELIEIPVGPYPASPLVGLGFDPTGRGLSVSGFSARRQYAMEAQRVESKGDAGSRWIGYPAVDPGRIGGALLTSDNHVAGVLVSLAGQAGSPLYAAPVEISTFFRQLGIAYPVEGGYIRPKGQ